MTNNPGDIGNIDKIIRLGKAGPKEDPAEILDKSAEWLGQKLASDELTNTQIRGIFDTTRQIEARWRGGDINARRELILLRSKLVYQSARNSKLDILKDWLDEGIKAVVAPSSNENDSEEQRFSRLMDFFEAVLAYHYAEAAKRKQEQARGRRS